ncbi:MAG: flagellar assembly protein J [Candidatus Methanofastidiosum methylothiophilum]|uniref:Flagellar assembly protein J n=1 Tax=Candidatus Methanofastidiosum methylothiophilum TaxID=1705564 RepID=A0A150J523_9EURY|nr:MAG: flagellar assembly protein J [Candidatus Methanofastidiosum methylthiophilus]
MRKKEYNIYIIIGSIAAGIILGLVSFFLLNMSEGVIAGIAVAVGPYLIIKMRQQAWITEIEDQFPEFLRALADSQAAGMTLPQAIKMAQEDDYGRLTDEIKVMASKISWGVPFDEVLTSFADKVKSENVQGTVSLIVIAHHAGGNIIKILESAAESARMMRGLAKEQASKLGQYTGIIYISYLVFLSVIFLLQTQFVAVFSEITLPTAKETINKDEFSVTFQNMLIIHGALAGLMIGKMTTNSLFSGVKHSIVLTAIGYLSFRFLINSTLLSGFLG